MQWFWEKYYGCEPKRAPYGTKAALYLSDKEICIFLPTIDVNKFCTKTVFRKFYANEITHKVYKEKNVNIFIVVHELNSCQKMNKR